MKFTRRNYFDLFSFIYSLSFVLVFLFLLWKCRFGFSYPDESFYLSIPYRIIQGDSLFGNEWHLSQMSAFLLYPILKVYFWFFNSTEGILLNFRYIYTIANAIVAFVSYIGMRKYNKIGAAFASLSILIFAPSGIMALSYFSMGIDCLLLSLVLLINAEENKYVLLILSGIFFASAVLCCPYLAILYIVYCFSCAFVFFSPKMKGNKRALEIIHGKAWVLFSSGVLFVAALFVAFVFRRLSISQFLISFSELFKDPEHPMMTFGAYIKSYFCAIVFSRKAKVYYVFFLIFISIVCADKLKQKRSIYYLLIAITVSMIYMCPAIMGDRSINFLMFPLNPLAILCIFLTDNITVKKLFYVGFLPGICYTFCINMASNQSFFAISAAGAVPLFFTIIILIITIRDIYYNTSSLFNKRLLIVSLSITLVTQIGLELISRNETVFWETSLSAQTELIGSGVQKGVFATKERKQEYEQLQNEVSRFEEDDAIKTVLFVSEDTWLYLGSSKKNGSFSAWLQPDEESTPERLQRYYELNPDKIPDAVFVEKEYSPVAYFFIQEGYRCEQNENGNLILMKS